MQTRQRFGAADVDSTAAGPAAVAGTGGAADGAIRGSTEAAAVELTGTAGPAEILDAAPEVESPVNAVTNNTRT